MPCLGDHAFASPESGTAATASAPPTVDTGNDWALVPQPLVWTTPVHCPSPTSSPHAGHLDLGPAAIALSPDAAVHGLDLAFYRAHVLAPRVTAPTVPLFSSFGPAPYPNSVRMQWTAGRPTSFWGDDESVLVAFVVLQAWAIANGRFYYSPKHGSLLRLHPEDFALSKQDRVRLAAHPGWKASTPWNDFWLRELPFAQLLALVHARVGNTARFDNYGDGHSSPQTRFWAILLQAKFMPISFSPDALATLPADLRASLCTRTKHLSLYHYPDAPRSELVEVTTTRVSASSSDAKHEEAADPEEASVNWPQCLARSFPAFVRHAWFGPLDPVVPSSLLDQSPLRNAETACALVAARYLRAPVAARLLQLRGVTATDCSETHSRLQAPATARYRCLVLEPWHWSKPTWEPLQRHSGGAFEPASLAASELLLRWIASDADPDRDDSAASERLEEYLRTDRELARSMPDNRVASIYFRVAVLEQSSGRDTGATISANCFWRNLFDLWQRQRHPVDDGGDDDGEVVFIRETMPTAPAPAPVVLKAKAEAESEPEPEPKSKTKTRAPEGDKHAYGYKKKTRKSRATRYTKPKRRQPSASATPMDVDVPNTEDGNVSGADTESDRNPVSPVQSTPGATPTPLGDTSAAAERRPQLMLQDLGELRTFWTEMQAYWTQDMARRTQRLQSRAKTLGVDTASVMPHLAMAAVDNWTRVNLLQLAELHAAVHATYCTPEILRKAIPLSASRTVSASVLAEYCKLASDDAQRRLQLQDRRGRPGTPDDHLDLVETQWTRELRPFLLELLLCTRLGWPRECVSPSPLAASAGPSSSYDWLAHVRRLERAAVRWAKQLPTFACPMADPLDPLEHSVFGLTKHALARATTTKAAIRTAFATIPERSADAATASSLPPPLVLHSHHQSHVPVDMASHAAFGGFASIAMPDAAPPLYAQMFTSATAAASIAPASSSATGASDPSVLLAAAPVAVALPPEAPKKKKKKRKPKPTSSSSDGDSAPRKRKRPAETPVIREDPQPLTPIVPRVPDADDPAAPPLFKRPRGRPPKNVFVEDLLDPNRTAMLNGGIRHMGLEVVVRRIAPPTAPPPVFATAFPVAASAPAPAHVPLLQHFSLPPAPVVPEQPLASAEEAQRMATVCAELDRLAPSVGPLVISGDHSSVQFMEIDGGDTGGDGSGGYAPYSPMLGVGAPPSPC